MSLRERLRSMFGRIVWDGMWRGLEEETGVGRGGARRGWRGRRVDKELERVKEGGG